MFDRHFAAIQADPFGAIVFAVFMLLMLAILAAGLRDCWMRARGYEPGVFDERYDPNKKPKEPRSR
jgi:hypothetical protein